MPSTGYTFDSIDLYSRYGCMVEKAFGHMGFPMRKGPTEYAWDDEDGAQAFTAEDDIQFEPRDITLKCYIKATTRENFYSKLSALRSACCDTGLHDLNVKYNPNTYRVYYRAGNPFEMLGKWNNTTNIGEFFLAFREPKPTYTATWKGLSGNWSMAQSDEINGGQLITNGSFETDTANWTNMGTCSTFERNTTTPISGTGDLHWVGNAADYSGAGSTSFSVTSGEPYRITFSYRKVGANAVYSKLSKTQSPASAAVDGTTPELLTATSNTDYEITVTPTETRTAYLLFYDLNVNAGEAYVDDISVISVYQNDKTSKDNDLLLFGPTYITDRKASSNAALDFDGVGNYGEIQDSFQSTLRNSFSVAMWAKPDDGKPAATELLCGVREDINNYFNFGVYLDGTLWSSYVSGGNGGNPIALTNSAVFIDGAETWHHLAITFDNESLKTKMYFDGVSQDLSSSFDGSLAGVSMGSFTSAENLYVGAFNAAGTATSFFAGGVQDVRLYSRSLSAEEVKVLYHTYLDGTLDI